MHNSQLENVVVLVSFDTFWAIILCKHRIGKFSNERCLSHRDEVFDTKFDSFRCFLTISIEWLINIEGTAITANK